MPTLTYTFQGQPNTVIIGSQLLPKLQFIASQTHVVVDRVLVDQLQLEDTSLTVLDVHEGMKNLETVQLLMQKLLQQGVNRQTTLVAIGGGVLSDIVGFTASILLRGINWIYIPSTLLAQVDTVLGGKTGVNTPEGKNLIGSFYPPRLALCDVNLLKTLPKRQWLAGYAEIVKYGLIADAEFFACLEAHNFLSMPSEMLIHLIHRCLQLKQQIIGDDWLEKTASQRQLLNLGHTFAHGFETLTNYQTLLHGEAVSLGIAAAFDMAAFMGLISVESAEIVRVHLQQRDLPIDYQSYITHPTFLEILKRDKKNSGKAITFILPKAIGEVFAYRDENAEAIQAFIAAHTTSAIDNSSVALERAS